MVFLSPFFQYIYPVNIRIVILILSLLFPPAVWALDLRWEAEQALQGILSSASRKGQFTWEEAFQTALVLEGIPVQRQEAYWSRLEELYQSMTASLKADLTPEQRADQLLLWLHQNSLKRYETLQTRISVVLDAGTFNCVSSALVYGLLADRLGLKVTFVGTRDHAFCVVDLGDRAVDVETTTSLGFDPGRKREFQDEFGKITGFAYVPATQYARRKPLGFPGLLGLLIQNLVAEAQQKGDVFTPLGLAWDRHTLEKNPESLDFLHQVFKNLMAYRNERKEYLTALAEVSRMRDLLGSSPFLGEIARSMVNNQLVSYFDRKDWKVARAFLAERKGDLASLEPVWKNNLDVGESKDIFTEGGLSALLAWTESRGADLPLAQRLTLEENYLLQTAAPLMNQKKWSETSALVEGLSPELRNRPKVVSLLQTLNYNKTVEIHNQFALLMNRRDVSGARKLLEAALKEFPDSEILRKNWALLPPE